VVIGVLAVTTVLSLRASKDPAKRSHALTGPPAE